MAVDVYKRQMQDMEFTIEDGHLYMLQTRNGKRTAQAALQIACDLVDEGMITEPVSYTHLRSESTFFKLVMLLGLILFCVGVLFAYKLMMPFMLRPFLWCSLQRNRNL